ncbi:HAD family hydrolase [Paenibacillus antri]|uniref:HAD family hydrolase n=1 Tax=Paenibacillus antri TaxID=2582848 RepID=A0A5R9GID4_9BACL|nr:HAD family hydrolase [Paenibacillus antri]TLS53148.1 HAD family hydrolase [Paenibacillus antri]
MTENGNRTETLNLLFDLDDTLIHCNKYFDLVIDQFADLVETWFASHKLTKEEIKKKQLELDLAGIHVHGFAAERFPESFAETYDHYSDLFGREPDPEERQRLLDLGYTVYDSEFELYPHVVDTLSRLRSEGHLISLYTGGVEKIQRAKVEKVNLGPFFEDRIFVAQHKNAEALERILTTMGFDRSRTWMIGNSLRTDIAPAVACGIGAVYIPPLSNWAFDLVDIPVGQSERLLRLESISQVPAALAGRRQHR